MGKVQELHHFEGIRSPDVFFILLLGFASSLCLAFFIQGMELLMPLSVVSLMAFFSYGKGRGYFALFLFSVLLGLGIGLFLHFFPLHYGACKMKGFVIMAKNNYFILSNGLTRVYVHEKGCLREVGDFLEIEGDLGKYQGTEYESRFSFASYLADIGVKESLSIRNCHCLFQRPFRLRERGLSFLSHFDSLTSGTIDSILFAHKDYANEMVAKASVVGCLGLLSGSGMVYGGLLRGIQKLFSYRFEEKKSSIITFFFAVMFLPFFLYKVGAYRVLTVRIMELFFLLRDKKKPDHLTLICLSGLILLTLDPYLVRNGGFLLGYGISIYMMVTKDLGCFYKKAVRRMISFLLLMIFLFPVFNVRGEWKLFAPFFSVLFLPIAYSYSFLAFVSFISVPFVRLLSAYSSALLQFLTFFEKIDLSLPLGSFPPWAIFLYYFALWLGIYLQQSGLVHFRRWINLIQIASLLIPSLPLGNAFLQEISFINVGQGDGILIRDGYTSVMIDTGGVLSFDMAREVDIPFFRKEKVYHLDCLIASHGDYDHIGAKESLCQHFPVKRFVTDAAEFPLTIGKLTFTNYNVYGGKEENDKSLVLSLDFMGKTWLFTGDAGFNIENQIIRDYPSLNVDVLKVGHHGSKTSSSLAFLKRLSPEMCIISVGKNNRYGHPDSEVIHRLESLGIPYRRTDEEGTITYRRYFGLPLREL